jgi:hypothetical protein
MASEGFEGEWYWIQTEIFDILTAILHKYLKSNQGRKSCKDIKNVLGGKGNLVKTSEANNEAG